MLNIKFFYLLTEVLLRKINANNCHLERVRLVFSKAGIPSSKKPLRSFLEIKNGISRILKLLVKFYEFLSWRILRK